MDCGVNAAVVSVRVGLRLGSGLDFLKKLVIVQTCDDIDPGDSINISILSAFDFTQVTPHSLRLKVDAPANINPMSVTADTSHVDRSWLKLDAPENMYRMSVTADTSHFDRSWLKAD